MESEKTIQFFILQVRQIRPRGKSLAGGPVVRGLTSTCREGSVGEKPGNLQAAAL